MAEMKKTYVLSAAAVGPDAHTDADGQLCVDVDNRADLRDALADCGLNIRRAGHFCELALAGSQTVIKRLGRTVPTDTPVYLGTGIGEAGNTRALFKQVMSDGAANASPYGFVASSSNTAAFYVAKAAGLRSRNMTVCQEEFSFEWALRLAASDIETGASNTALAGGADEYCPPRSEHIHRLPLSDGQAMGEGSGWLYLSCGNSGAIGEVLGVWDFVFAEGDRGGFAKEAASLIGKTGLSGGNAFLLPGFRLDGAMIDGLVKKLPGIEVERYIERCGAFHAAAAFAAASVFEGRGRGQRVCFHVNTGTSGRAFVFAILAYA